MDRVYANASGISAEQRLRDHKHDVEQLGQLPPNPTVVPWPRNHEFCELSYFWSTIPPWKYRCDCCCKIFATNDELVGHR